MIRGFSPDHPSWSILRAEMSRRVELSRTALETHGMTAEDTEFERGQVAALRRLISDIEEAPVEPVSAPGYEH